MGEYYGVTTSDILGLVLFSIVTYIFQALVKNSLEHGVTPGYVLDVLAINLFSQFLISFTRYGWWIYSIVPIYILIKLSGFIWGYISNSNKAAQEPPKEVDPAVAKKQAKMERKEARGQ